MQGESGFTMVEALVALVILAFASVAMLRAAETHIMRIGGLESRAIAGWVAENRMTELSLAPAAAAELPGEVKMLGRGWVVDQQIGSTADPHLAEVTVRVRGTRPADPAVRLTGFVDMGAVQ